MGPGALVAVQGRNRIIHWIILLACERIGAPTASLDRTQLNDGDAVFRLASWVIADGAIPPAPDRRSHRITLEWISATFDRPVSASALADLAETPDGGKIVRYTFTSGTTGEPKTLVMNARMFIRQGIGMTRDCPLYRYDRPRFLCAYAFPVRAAHTRASGCLLLGGTVIFTRQDTILCDLRRHRPQLAAMLTGTVSAVLRAMPADYPKPPSLVLSTTGAPLGRHLPTEALRRLASEVIDLYSMSETSSVALVGSDGVGTVLPNTEVAIVDEDGRPLPYGTVGLIKIRNDTMCDGYVDDPLATARHFRDGWFITNDVGVILAPGRLRLLGRHDDILLLGGIKQLPFPIEERLRGVTGVREALAVAVGATTLGSIVELDVGVALDPVLPAITAAMNKFWPHIAVRAITAIAHTRGEKPDRRAAAALFG